MPTGLIFRADLGIMDIRDPLREKVREDHRNHPGFRRGKTGTKEEAEEAGAGPLSRKGNHDQNIRIREQSVLYSF
jgi:hypothetical protein